MLIFHEGLPRSGKSYEAVAKRIVPALAKHRPVQAYIEGLNHSRLADLAGISEDECEELLTCITREQMQSGEWLDLIKDNSLCVFDEAQNFWPTGQKTLSVTVTQFVTEHGHRGLDIVLMGQDVRDVHPLWRRRVDQKIVFQKLDTFGASNRYKWSVFKGAVDSKGIVKYVQVQKGTEKYDPKIFGSYASHVSDETNKDTYSDKRAVLWNSWHFRFGIPVFLVVCVFAFNYVWKFFHSDGSIVAAQKVSGASPMAVAPRPAASVPAAAASAPAVPLDYVQDISKRWRVRLSGVIAAADRQEVVLEWLDESLHRRERFSAADLRALGWHVVVSGAVARLSKGGVTVIASAWPIDADGAISQRSLDLMRGDRDARSDDAHQSGEARQAPAVAGFEDAGQYPGPRKTDLTLSGVSSLSKN